MDVYWTAAQAWWEQAEYETMLYETELEDFKARHPPLTLKAYMIATRGQPR